jgi:hypothetical protein
MKLIKYISAICIFQLVSIICIVGILSPVTEHTSVVKASTTTTEKNVTSISLTPTATTSLAPMPVVPSKNQTPIPLPSPTFSPVPTTDTRCIVLVDGEKFDVSEFRRIHSGGDIFQCGADMSAIFHSQHTQSEFTKLQKYRVP